jgi:hypothetical protein
MPNSVPRSTLIRRRVTQLFGMAAGSPTLSSAARAAEAPGVTLEIAPYTPQASPKHHIRTVAYKKVRRSLNNGLNSDTTPGR